MKKMQMVWMLMMVVVACDSGTDMSPMEEGNSPLFKMGKADWSMEGTEEHFSSGFNWVNDPEEFVPGMERKLSALPLQGQASRIPWSDTYWPKNKGSISRRWSNEWMTRQVPRSAEEARTWTQSELQALSPAEKYDLFVGNYQYSLTSRVAASSSPTTPSWQGHCHGWTIASIHYPEPSPITVVNDDGIEIPFGSSDIKALLTYYHGDVVQSLWGESILPFTRDVKVGGGTCLSESAIDPNCQDANPGLFHITMGNFLGLRNQAFGIDATTTREKWNHPVYRYRTEILGERTPGPGAQEEAVREVIVRSYVTYVTEIEAQWDPVLSTQHQATVDKVYTYTLELNDQGEIMGGQWILLLEDMTTPTYRQAWAYLTTVDEEGDGSPDYTKDEAQNLLWGHFDFPDYVWFQEKAPFAEEFKQAGSAYVFLANSPGSRKDLFHYFAQLKNLISP